MAFVAAALIVIGATAAILRLPRLASRHPIALSRLAFVNTQLAYQVGLLGIAAVILLALLLVSPANLRAFLSVGDPGAPAAGVAWLGIGRGESWLSIGLTLSVVITGATTLFMLPQLRASAAALPRLGRCVPWIGLFAVTNALGEEVVYRLGIVVPLAGSVDGGLIVLASAIAFGAPHLRGIPNGLVGASMAGVLGWLLATSVLETGGLWWAWFIHFLQDIVIYSALVLGALASAPDHSGADHPDVPRSPRQAS